MRPLIIIFSTLIFSFPTYGQKATNNFIFNEFNISLNKTTPPTGDFEQQLGFGIGAFHSIMNHKKVNFIFGLEYNLNRQFFNSTYEGHFANATNVQYTIHNMSIPFNLRYNIGKNIKVFTELGGFLDLIVNAKRKGVMHTYFPDENNTVVYNEFTFKEKAKITGPNFGISGGIGIKIPVKTRELIIKTDYKFGIPKLYSVGTDFYIRYYRVSIGINI